MNPILIITTPCLNEKETVKKAVSRAKKNG